MRVALVLVALIAIAPLSLASSPYTASGIFAAGVPVLGTKDACMDTALQGKTSDCVAMRSDARGKGYHIGAHSAAPIVDLATCFYNASTLLRCDKADTAGAIKTGAKAWLRGEDISGLVPANATHMAVSASAGGAVSWLFNSL